MCFDRSACLQEVTAADQCDESHIASTEGVQVLDHVGHLAPIDTAGLVVVGEVEDHGGQRNGSGRMAARITLRPDVK